MSTTSAFRPKQERSGTRHSPGIAAQDAYTELLKVQIAPVLRDLGFRGSGGNHKRKVGDDWQIINFQKSRRSSRSRVLFTVNLGVGLAAYRDAVHAWPDERPPPHYRCHLRDRLGPLGDDGDLWWDVDERTDLEVVAADVLQRLARDGIPWLERAHETRADRYGHSYP